MFRTGDDRTESFEVAKWNTEFHGLPLMQMRDKIIVGGFQFYLHMDFERSPC